MKTKFEQSIQCSGRTNLSYDRKQHCFVRLILLCFFYSKYKKKCSNILYNSRKFKTYDVNFIVVYSQQCINDWYVSRLDRPNEYYQRGVAIVTPEISPHYAGIRFHIFSEEYQDTNFTMGNRSQNGAKNHRSNIWHSSRDALFTVRNDDNNFSPYDKNRNIR